MLGLRSATKLPIKHVLTLGLYDTTSFDANWLPIWKPSMSNHLLNNNIILSNHCQTENFGDRFVINFFKKEFMEHCSTGVRIAHCVVQQKQTAFVFWMPRLISGRIHLEKLSKKINWLVNWLLHFSTDFGNKEKSLTFVFFISDSFSCQFYEFLFIYEVRIRN